MATRREDRDVKKGKRGKVKRDLYSILSKKFRGLSRRRTKPERKS
jgi:hypothetical protein